MAGIGKDRICDLSLSPPTVSTGRGFSFSSSTRRLHVLAGAAMGARVEPIQHRPAVIEDEPRTDPLVRRAVARWRPISNHCCETRRKSAASRVVRRTSPSLPLFAATMSPARRSRWWVLGAVLLMGATTGVARFLRFLGINVGSPAATRAAQQDRLFGADLGEGPLQCQPTTGDRLAPSREACPFCGTCRRLPKKVAGPGIFPEKIRRVGY